MLTGVSGRDYSSIAPGAECGGKSIIFVGNAYRNKAIITFCTDDGDVKQVETTVWCYDDKFVLLKSGTFLPLKSILKIENC